MISSAKIALKRKLLAVWLLYQCNFLLRLLLSTLDNYSRQLLSTITLDSRHLLSTLDPRFSDTLNLMIFVLNIHTSGYPGETWLSIFQNPLNQIRERCACFVIGENYDTVAIATTTFIY